MMIMEEVFVAMAMKIATVKMSLMLEGNSGELEGGVAEVAHEMVEDVEVVLFREGMKNGKATTALHTAVQSPLAMKNHQTTCN